MGVKPGISEVDALCSATMLAPAMDASPQIPPSTGARSRGLLPFGLRILHAVIIVSFAVNMFYAAYMVFVGMAPDGHVGPLWSAATSMDPQLLMIRRLYAIEFWISTAGLALYLAVTEYLPRLLVPLLSKVSAQSLVQRSARTGEGIDR